MSTRKLVKYAMETTKVNDTSDANTANLGHQLVGFGFGNALDGNQLAQRRVRDRLHCVVAGILKLFHVGRRNAGALQARVSECAPTRRAQKKKNNAKTTNFAKTSSGRTTFLSVARARGAAVRGASEARTTHLESRDWQRSTLLFARLGILLVLLLLCRHAAARNDELVRAGQVACARTSSPYLFSSRTSQCIVFGIEFAANAPLTQLKVCLLLLRCAPKKKKKNQKLRKGAKIFKTSFLPACGDLVRNASHKTPKHKQIVFWTQCNICRYFFQFNFIFNCQCSSFARGRSSNASHKTSHFDTNTSFIALTFVSHFLCERVRMAQNGTNSQLRIDRWQTRAEIVTEDLAAHRLSRVFRCTQ